MEKISATLSDRCVKALRSMAIRYRAKVSVLTEAAITSFADLPELERDQLVRRVSAAKKAYTRARWRTTFWRTLRTEFWLPSLAPSVRENEFAPRVHGGFQIWFLYNSIADPEPEDGPFLVRVDNTSFQTTPTWGIEQQFVFERSQSPYDAANEIATYIREKASSIGTLEFIETPGGVRVMIDHFSSSWHPERTVNPAMLPMNVRGKRSTYMLKSGYRFQRLP